jgi:FAD/FMN-containing dehydrogenase
VSTEPGWRALASVIAGEVVLPGSAQYDAARKPPILRFHDVRPQAVVRCASPGDVAETLAFVRRVGLRATVRSGGHCFAGRSSTGDVVLDVTPMDTVSVEAGRARVGAGARLGDVYDSLSGHGVTIPAGCGPTVGIAGLTLGGGLGVLGRAYGLTCDSLRAAEVVLPAGRVVECDQDRYADLFWALRGGGGVGGGVGVVTALTFETLPAPEMTSFRLVWPHTSAADVLTAWQDWSPSAPDELAASLLLTAPPDPDEPPQALVFGSMIGAEPDALAQLGELVARVGVDPASAEHRTASHRETKRHLVATGPDHGDGLLYVKSGYFARPLPADAVAALVAQWAGDRMPGQARVLDLTPWAGAYNRVPPGATAFVHRSERFLLQHATVVTPEAPHATRTAAVDWLRESHRIVDPWHSAGVYQNFPDPDLPDPDAAYFGANLPRLRRVRERYDPDDLLSPAAASRTSRPGRGP